MKVKRNILFESEPTWLFSKSLLRPDNSLLDYLDSAPTLPLGSIFSSLLSYKPFPANQHQLSIFVWSQSAHNGVGGLHFSISTLYTLETKVSEQESHNLICKGSSEGEYSRYLGTLLWGVNSWGHLDIHLFFRKMLRHFHEWSSGQLRLCRHQCRCCQDEWNNLLLFSYDPQG